MTILCAQKRNHVRPIEALPSISNCWVILQMYYFHDADTFFSPKCRPSKITHVEKTYFLQNLHKYNPSNKQLMTAMAITVFAHTTLVTDRRMVGRTAFP